MRLEEALLTASGDYDEVGSERRGFLAASASATVSVPEAAAESGGRSVEARWLSTHWCS